jgi:hypothetical protein
VKIEKAVQAAGKLFARQGYHGTSTREIAQLGEVSENTLFRHFDHKEDLFWAAIRWQLASQKHTCQGQLFGDWIGREDKGGQAWITWHLSGNQWIQASLRNQKATTYFIPGGTTLNDINFQAVKRIGKDLEINGNFAYERWKAPIYMSGQQTVTTTTIQLTWFPGRKVSFSEIDTRMQAELPPGLPR